MYLSLDSRKVGKDKENRFPHLVVVFIWSITGGTAQLACEEWTWTISLASLLIKSSVKVSAHIRLPGMANEIERNVRPSIEGRWVGGGGKGGRLWNR